MYKMDVVFNKDHELSILQIAGENIVHYYYKGIQKHCKFPHFLCIVIIEGRLICSVFWIIQYQNLFSKLGTK